MGDVDYGQEYEMEDLEVIEMAPHDEDDGEDEDEDGDGEDEDEDEEDEEEDEDVLEIEDEDEKKENGDAVVPDTTDEPRTPIRKRSARKDNIQPTSGRGIKRMK